MASLSLSQHPLSFLTPSLFLDTLSLSQHPAVYHHHFYLFLYCVNYLHSALYRTYLLYFSY